MVNCSTVSLFLVLLCLFSSTFVAAAAAIEHDRDDSSSSEAEEFVRNFQEEMARQEAEAVIELGLAPNYQEDPTAQAYLSDFLSTYEDFHEIKDDDKKSRAALQTPPTASFVYYFINEGIVGLAYSLFENTNFETVQEWFQIYSPKRMLKLRNFLTEHLDTPVKLSEAVAVMEVEIRDDLVNAIEKFLMRAELNRQLPPKHVKYLQYIKPSKRPVFLNLFYRWRARGYFLPLGIRLENAIALEYYLLFHNRGLLRDIHIMSIISVTSIRLPLERGVLNMTWFSNRLAELQRQVCDLERPALQLDADTNSEDYKRHQEEWQRVMESEYYSVKMQMNH